MIKKPIDDFIVPLNYMKNDIELYITNKNVPAFEENYYLIKEDENKSLMSCCK